MQSNAGPEHDYPNSTPIDPFFAFQYVAYITKYIMSITNVVICNIVYVDVLYIQNVCMHDTKHWNHT